MKTLKNYVYNMVYQLLNLIVPIITTPYISRILKADGLGRYSVSQTVMEYFVMFGLLGMATYGSRQIAYVRDNEEQRIQAFWDLNAARAITMVVSTLFYLVFCCFSGEDRLLYLVQIFTVLASLIDISWYFAGMERFRITAIRNIIVKIASVILIFCFIKEKDDIYLYALIVSLSLFIGQTILWKEVINKFAFRIPIPKNVMVYIRGSFKLWLPTIAASIYTSFDKLMLSFFTDDEQVGWYVNSQKIVKIATTVTTSLATVTIPKAANSFSNGRVTEMKSIVSKSLIAVSFLAFPMCTGLMAIRETLVPWFLGAGFEHVSDLLLISSLLIITLSWSSILANQVLVASKKENLYTLSIIIAAVVNFLLNLILIPRFKSDGALFTSVLAEYIGMLLMLFFARNIIKVRDFANKVVKYIITSILMYFLVYYIGKFMQPTVLTTTIQVIVGLSLYSIVMLVSRDEILMYVLNALKNKIQGIR